MLVYRTGSIIAFNVNKLDPSWHIGNVKGLLDAGRYSDCYEYVINNMGMMKIGTIQNEIWIKLGNYKFDQDEYDKALKMYNNITNYDDEYNDDNKVYLNIAYCYHQLNKAQQALRYYYKHLNINKKDVYCINNIAVLEYYNQNYMNALRMYKRMNIKHQIQNGLYFNIGICYLQTADYKNALNYFYKHLSLQTNRNRDNCYISIAWIYSKIFNDYLKALDIYNNKLNESIINKKDLEFEIAYNYQQIEQDNNALIYYKKYLKKHKNNINTLHNIAWIKINKMNDFDAAKPFLIKILFLNKKHFYANYVYGVYLRDIVKDYHLSLKCLKIAHNVQPNDVQIINEIAKLNHCITNKC